MKRRLITSIMALSIVGLLAACGSSSEVPEAGTTSTPDTEEQQEAQEDAKQEEQQEEQQEIPYFNDGVLETDDMTIKVTDYKVLQAGEDINKYGDGPIIVFYYDITNKTGKEMTPSVQWPLYFDAIQDNDENSVNELNIAITFGDDNDVEMQKIEKGGTVSANCAYKLDDDVTPVDLVAKEMLGDELGSMRCEIQ